MFYEILELLRLLTFVLFVCFIWFICLCVCMYNMVVCLFVCPFFSIISEKNSYSVLYYRHILETNKYFFCCKFETTLYNHHLQFSIKVNIPGEPHPLELHNVLSQHSLHVIFSKVLLFRILVVWDLFPVDVDVWHCCIKEKIIISYYKFDVNDIWFNHHSPIL
jgi:hypothetical protein